MLTSVRACFRAEGEGRASLDATQRRRRHLRNPRPPFYRTLAALVLPQEEVMCCFPRARPDYESRGLRFSQKQKKKREKGFGDAIEQWDRSVVEIPWRRARSLERGGRGGGKSPAREANGSRWSPRADGAAERLAQKASSRGGASNAGRPPPSSALNTGLHMK